MAVMNQAASVLARLKNQAKLQKISYSICLQLFVQEEFLRRLSVSAYRNQMILKGGMFIYTLTEFDSRPTRDIDFLARKISNNPDHVLKVMKEICSAPTNYSFIKIDVLQTSSITLDKKYPGIKTKLMGYISNVHIPFSIDIGIDDVIIQGPVLRKIPTQLEGFEKPEIYTYSIESTIAEKLDAILQRMETTSRMKDFYDIYYLSCIYDFDGEVLCRAIKETMLHRGHELQFNRYSRIVDFSSNQFLITQWKAFEPAKESGLSFASVLNPMLDFLSPVIYSANEDKTFGKQWNHSIRLWE